MQLNRHNSVLAWHEKVNGSRLFYSKRTKHMSIEITEAGIRTPEHKTSGRCAE